LNIINIEKNKCERHKKEYFEAQILIGKSTVWKYKKKSGVEIWYAGNKNAVLDVVDSLLGSEVSSESLIKNLSKRNEFFSVVVKTEKEIFAFTDFCRSYPIFYSVQNDKLMLSNDANKLKDKSNKCSVREKSILDCLALGYVTGNNTLYSNIHQLGVCQFLLAKEKLTTLIVDKYFLYHEVNINKSKSEVDLVNSLGEVINKSIDRLIEKADGAQIVVPISGGLDSRLVLAKLVEHGCDNLRSFSYGPIGNSDAKIGQEVSERLGVSWKFIPVEANESREFYQSDIRKKYSLYADGLNVVPNYQDLIPIYKLKASGYLSSDCIIVNGQSGDFNTGGHIPNSLMNKDADTDDLLSEIIKKHYSLWDGLLTEENLGEIKENIIAHVFNGDDVSSQDDIGHEKLVSLYERWEFEERQTKYIVNGQRVYDYFSINWHLPLWDGEFVRFWCQVPLDFRYKQNLYKKYLKDWDYKGLFNDYNPAINAWSYKAAMLVVPFSLLLRLFVGRKRRDYLIKYFDYISRYGNHYHSFGIMSYLKNRLKIRNSISMYAMSWLCERGLSNYVIEKGLRPISE